MILNIWFKPRKYTNNLWIWLNKNRDCECQQIWEWIKLYPIVWIITSLPEWIPVFSEWWYNYVHDFFDIKHFDLL